MITEQHAHLWGMKAARAGLPLSANPYRNSQSRAAWFAGHRQEPRTNPPAIAG